MTKPSSVGRRRGESAGRNRSERRFSIVNPASDHADSTGFVPGASLSPRGEACYGSEYSEKESESPDGVQDGGTQRQRIKLTGETLFGRRRRLRRREGIRGEPKAQQRSRAGSRRWPKYR